MKYYPHDGESHAGGYGVDIDFGVDTGNAVVDDAGYDEAAHREQIKRYLACGARLVYIGNRIIASNLGAKVIYDEKHKNHDHINVKTLVGV